MATLERPRTEVRAEARYVRTAPRKAQLVADQIRGRSVPEARTILAFMERDAARDVRKVLDSAVANAEANHGLLGDDLYVAAAFVGAGPTLKRWRARARGRVARIRKRTCHITVELALPAGEAIPAPGEQATVESTPVEEEAKPRRAARKQAGARKPTPTAEDEPKPKQAQTETATPEGEKPESEKKPKRTPRSRAKKTKEKEA